MVEDLDKRVQEIESSTSSLESQLRAQIARTQSGTRAWLIVGIILIAIVFIYMSWIARLAKDVLTPSGLVEIVESEAGDRLPAVLSTLEETLVEEASNNVDFVLAEALKKIPDIRRQAEAGVDALMGQFADKLDEKVDEIVADLLAKKKQELDPLIKAAAQKGESEALEAAFRTSLEELIGYKMDEVLVQYDAHMAAIERRLDRLALSDEKLSSEERLEKELVTAILIFIDDAVKTMEQEAATPPTAAP